MSALGRKIQVSPVGTETNVLHTKRVFLAVLKNEIKQNKFF